MNYTKINFEEEHISQKLNFNLYLQTIPLVGKLDKCEIEDLYQEETLNLTINEKKFSRDTDIDQKRYFGKSIFSRYIIDHYNEIDFSNFIKLLDCLVVN